jgi:basic amino acid/polyamine antiporter, APA family
VENQPTLKRSINYPLLTLYGLGTIVGAGIYVLVGEVVNEAGLYAPVSFLLAAAIATFTAFTYAELSSRFPRSAGEAYYTQRAFNNKVFSGAIGWSIVVIGVVSTATITNGFVGYFNVYVEAPAWIVIIGLIVALAIIAGWGITESVWLAAVITVIEVGGLLFVIVIATQIETPQALEINDLVPSLDSSVWLGVALGAFLAFYAYIGFEDMVNVAEEVIHPRHTLPLGILTALVISTLLYILVAIAAIYAVPVSQLSVSNAPLVDIVKQYSQSAVVVMGVISMIAVVNGALIQIIMASRVIYGMACQKLAPDIFSRVNAKTSTPLWATGLATVVVLILALTFSLVTLAKLTSFVTLLVFAVMHLALLIIKKKEPDPVYATVYPAWIPVIGLIVSLALVGFQIWASW